MSASRAPESYLGFRLAGPQRRELDAVVAALRAAPESARARERFGRLVVDLTRAGLGRYFVGPLEQAGAGARALRLARLGVTSAGRGIPFMVRKVLGSLAAEQLVALADALEGMVLEVEEGPPRPS